MAELQDLRYFQVAACSPNFTKAAERLYVSRQTLSRSIGKLESSLGVALFNRSGHATSLTREGEELKAAVDDALSRLDAIDRMFDKGAESRDARPLRLAVAPYATLCVAFNLTETLARFDRDVCPLEVSSPMMGEMVEGLAGGRLDCGLALTMDLAPSGLRAEVIDSAPVALLTSSQDGAFADGVPLSWLDGRDLYASPDAPLSYRPFFEECERRRVGLRLVTDCADTYQALANVASGVTVGLGRYSSVHALGGLETRLIDDYQEPVYFCALRGSTGSAGLAPQLASYLRARLELQD